MEFKNLDEEVRSLMLEEIDLDVAGGSLYGSRVLNNQGSQIWESKLRSAIENGNEEVLAIEISGYINATEQYIRNGVEKTRKVARNANERLAQGEFNRFYIRAVCLKAIANGDDEVRIYRARYSENPRPESEARVGATCNAQDLLNDLRANPGGETVLQVPGGPNSGISVELIN